MKLRHATTVENLNLIMTSGKIDPEEIENGAI